VGYDRERCNQWENISCPGFVAWEELTEKELKQKKGNQTRKYATKTERIPTKHSL
jgi:hypothetical protein